MSNWLSAVGGWFAEAGHWFASVPDGILGAVIGVIATQLVTSVSTYRRRRDEYRAPQRAAIGGLLAAANQLKVSISAAIEYSGMSDRATTDEGSLEVLNTFFRELFGLDEAFEIAFLTVVDGPCYDQLVAAERPLYALRETANNPILSRTDTAEGFAAFMVRLGTASDNLDDDLGYLVELAQRRLRPSRRLFSQRPTVTRDRKGKPRPSIERGDAPSSPARQAAFLLSQSGSPTRQQVLFADQSLNSGSKTAAGTHRIKGAELSRAHVGRYVVAVKAGGQIPGKIIEVLPILTDSERNWVVTVHWAGPNINQVEQVKVMASDFVDLVEDGH